ncbi:hypothetical protein TTHERM_00384680 (macronuclear) [Tetrahymena thermophila SB210]|uniref:Uncharacterized protein n=1 Tax=Tetrahymena thermophila (strain SB210) TaxID=312017 RepID=Q23RM4_TETTS|nr:hypothetical protein TTHERM_00384680 [Tetrahymena thermophila SB210]EAR99024.2 hypothetical protein TTHERM_00384680 [Tetrahymena thermophila SB210]|eukprot:XP_001019269.2 hypothetical protein TTHERM_00384680 [Tetrahymena thermophila SB210]
MIKRKYRNQNGVDYIQGKLITMPQTNTTSSSSLVIKKDDKQSFARVIRMQSEKKLTNNDSFRSESRQKLIRDVYTPSQKDKLNQSIRKLNSSQSRQSVNNSSQKNVLYGMNKSQTQRKSSAKEQVRMIQNNLAPQDKEQDKQFKSLSKLVDYNLYKNQSSNANRQRIFDQNRSQLQGRSSMHATTNQSILKVQQLQNNQSSKTTYQNQKNYHNQNKPQLIEINGNSSSIHLKNQSLAIQTSKALSSNSGNLPLLTSKSNTLGSPSSQPKTFRYGTESVQIKENKIIRQKDQPRYNYPKKYENKIANSHQLPSNLQPKSRANNNKMY